MKEDKDGKMEPVNDDAIYWPIARAAAKIGISEWALRQKLRKGLVPFVQSGDSSRVNLQILRQILQKESLDNMQRQFEAAKKEGLVTPDDEQMFNHIVRLLTGGDGSDDGGAAK